jgi:glucosamine 6-phosphate synthetase-like amidotransferase/phosphosugar isomerase protein
MAKDVIVEERVLKRGGGAAATFAFFAMLLSVVALVIALNTQGRVNDATNHLQTVREKLDKLSAHVDNALGKQSTTGNAANGAHTTGGNNPVPTANGQ